MSAKIVAKRIIQILENRSGFDHWWDDLDEDVKKEIIGAIADELDNV